MAFFRNDLFLCSICTVCIALWITVPDCRAQDPDLALSRLALGENPEWKVRVLYGHGADVSHKISTLPDIRKKGVYGEPYFLDTDKNMPDDVLYRKVNDAITYSSIPYMRIKAFMLWHGRGTKRNTALAVQLWTIAAKAGDETSTDLLSRIPETSDETIYTRRYRTLKRSRLKLKYGRMLYVPRLWFAPEKSVSMLQLRKEEKVAAFLARAVKLWMQGGQVNVLLAPDD